MSTHADKETACPNNSENSSIQDSNVTQDNRQIKSKKVSFPIKDEDLVSQYFEAANPWQDIPYTTAEQLVTEYVESCRKHQTEPLQSVVSQVKDLPVESIGGATRAPKLSLSMCELRGSKTVDALEALFKKVQFQLIEVEYASLDDEAAEALFDMAEYYESAVLFKIVGKREFGIRGWQAASRMIKNSSELSEVEISWWSLEASHAPVLSRALRPVSCGLRALTLQAASLAGDALLCLVLALKCNTSVRELRLGDNELSVEDAIQIASLLRINRTLQLLDLSNNRIQDTGVRHISEALVHQAALTPPSNVSSPLSPTSAVIGFDSRGLSYLVLWNNQLTRNCAAHLSKALRASKSLCVLNIGRNPVGIEGLKIMREAALISGGLQAVRLGADAAPHLHMLLTSNTSLQRLDLRENKLGEAGLEAILSGMKDNNTLTQIDLDDVPEPSTLSLAPGAAPRLLREIRALCRRNVPLVTPPRPHRKISLTCHTTHPPAPSVGRLRSPAPSPASSPTPHHRFEVTRVSGGGESSSGCPPSPRSPQSSRFTVLQVKEPPKIHVQIPAESTPKRKSTSRFSVTRNYDMKYDTSKSVKPSVSDTTLRASSDVSVINVKTSDKSEAVGGKTEENVKGMEIVNASDKNDNDKVSVVKNVIGIVIDNSTAIDDSNKAIEVKEKSEKNVVEIVKSDSVNVIGNVNICESSPVTSSSSQVYSPTNVKSSEDSVVKSLNDDMSVKKVNFDEISVKNVNMDETSVKNVNIDETSIKIENVDIPSVYVPEKSVNDEGKSVKSVNLTDLSVKIDTKVLKQHKDVAFKQIEAITEDLGNLIKEMRDLTIKTVNIAQTAKETDVSQILKKNSSDPNLLSNAGNIFNFDAKENKKIEMFSQESSMESTSDTIPHFLNLSLSSDDSISPILFSKNKKIHGSISSLEASVSSLDSNQKAATSSDSGVEISKHEDYETLTLNSGLKELGYSDETLTNSPKRTASLLDVPSLNKVTDPTRKISLTTPSSSQKPETKAESKLPSHLEKLLSLFQHPSSIFSRNNEETKNTDVKKKEIVSSFWNWGAGEKSEKEDGDSDDNTSTENTIDESEIIDKTHTVEVIDKKETDLDVSRGMDIEKADEIVKNEENIDNWNKTGIESKLDTERVQLWYVDEDFSKKLDSKTPSSEADMKISEITTDEVQIEKVDNIDLNAPNDYNKNICDDPVPILTTVDIEKNHLEKNINRPRTFAAVLKTSDTENLDRQTSPGSSTSVDKLDSKVMREIKENISPENTITASMSNAIEMGFLEKEGLIWNETSSSYTNADLNIEDQENDDINEKLPEIIENIDLGKDALSYLTNEAQDFDPTSESIPILEKNDECIVLSEELKDAESKQKLIDLSPELVIDNDVFESKTSILIPERANFKSNSLENLSHVDKKEDTQQKIEKCLSFKEPETVTSPRDIPERRHRSKSGSSPKSLPDCLNKTSFSKIETGCCRKKKKVSSLGKMARDSLLALNMSEDEIAEFRRSYKLTSVESLKSLESVSEDANASGCSDDSRCKSCIRTSQESLMSLDSMNEDCKCEKDS